MRGTTLHTLECLRVRCATNTACSSVAGWTVQVSWKDRSSPGKRQSDATRHHLRVDCRRRRHHSRTDLHGHARRTKWARLTSFCNQHSLVLSVNLIFISYITSFSFVVIYNYVTCYCYWYCVLCIAAYWQLLLLNEYQSITSCRSLCLWLACSCSYYHVSLYQLTTLTIRNSLTLSLPVENLPLSQIFPGVDFLPASGLTPRTLRLDCFFWAPLLCFSVFIIIVFVFWFRAVD